MSWIEHHLLAHTLTHSINTTFTDDEGESEPPGTTVSSLHKKYSYLKNDILRKELLSCLQALEQQSVDISSGPMCSVSGASKTLFIEEFTPWVSEKIRQENEMRRNPPHDTVERRISQTSHTSFNKTDHCTISHRLSDHNVPARSKRSGSTYSEDILLKSALCAAVQQNMVEGKNSGWYNDDTDRLSLKSQPSITSRLSHMKEISRSDSSLFRLVKLVVRIQAKSVCPNFLRLAYSDHHICLSGFDHSST